MRLNYFSYRYAKEILENSRYRLAYDEIDEVVRQTPLFLYPNKSRNNPRLDVVQQVLNTYFDRRFAVDLSWLYHPLATGIIESGLKADFRKSFDNLTIQAEVQFGNMARWYSDIFKFQAAYSQNLIQMGLSIVPMRNLAVRIDSNVVNYERVIRELPSAELSITLPILVIGIDTDEDTPVVNISECQFEGVGQITGRGHEDNKWRIVNGYLRQEPMNQINANSEVGYMLQNNEEE
jgi:hypothetical protein